jgi:hypothetical protein
MNKQIQKLIKQCTTYYNGGLGTEIEVFDKEKFAQLIVAECANACLATTEPGSSIHLVSVAYADAVKRHFGIA